MGFCLFDNVAVGAQHALDAHDARRVMIFDFDVHHGNGTNAIFHDRDDVLFCSIHQSPLYPGTGPASDVGHGRGEGFTVNMPVPGGSGDAVVPVARRARRAAARPPVRTRPCCCCRPATTPTPTIRSPAARVTDGGYRSLAALLRATADELGVPLGLVLEGGYDLGALSRSVVATLEAIGAPEPAPPAVVEPHPLAERARERLAARHWPAMASA